MNAKIWIPLTAALVTGSAAAWTGYQLISLAPKHQAAAAVYMDQVVVASRPIPAGQELGAEDLAIVRVERGALSGMVSGIASVQGRVTAEPIAQGQPLSEVLLAQPGTQPGIAAAIPDGFRALTVAMDPHSGLSGFLFPDARVDVIAALGTGDAATARAVAQNVRVLAVAGRTRGQRNEPGGEEAAALNNKYSVTLMVTIEQAAAIELAMDAGMPRLALRPSGDDAILPFVGITMAQLRGEVFGDPWNAVETVPITADPMTAVDPATQPSGGGSATLEIKPRTRTHVIEVIRGGIISRTEMPIRSGSSRPADRAVVNNPTQPVDR